MDHGDSVVRFGPFEFDFEERVLRRDGDLVPLQPQPTVVLAALLERPGCIVSRAELQESVWRYRSAALEGGLNFNVRQVRKALGDDANAPAYIETVPRRGYRFVARLERARVAPAEHTARRWLTLPTGAAALAAGIWLVLGVGSGTGASELRVAVLDRPTQTAFEAAQWLYDHKEYGRSLTRLDSVRLAVPTYAPAWMLTARSRMQLQDLDGALAAVDRALELDETSADGHYLKGLTLFFQSRGPEALQALQSAVELDPSKAVYHQWLAQVLANALCLDEAIEELEEARRIAPVAHLVGVDLAQVYLAAGRYQDALEFCDASLELVPSGEEWARDCLMSAHHFLGDAPLALKEAHALMRLAGAGESEVEGVRDLRDYFEWDLARVDSEPGSGPGFARVRALARLEDREGVLAAMRTLRSARDYTLQWAPRDVWLTFLHGDPDFDAILREAGLPVPESQ